MRTISAPKRRWKTGSGRDTSDETPGRRLCWGAGLTGGTMGHQTLEVPVCRSSLTEPPAGRGATGPRNGGVHHRAARAVLRGRFPRWDNPGPWRKGRPVMRRVLPRSAASSEFPNQPKLLSVRVSWHIRHGPLDLEPHASSVPGEAVRATPPCLAEVLVQPKVGARSVSVQSFERPARSERSIRTTPAWSGPAARAIHTEREPAANRNPGPPPLT